MYCPQCGAKAAENAKFCIECGTKLPQHAQPGDSPKTTSAASAEKVLPKVEIPSPLPLWLKGYTPLLQQARIASNNEEDVLAAQLAEEDFKQTHNIAALEQAVDGYLATKEWAKAEDTLKRMEQAGAAENIIALHKIWYYLSREDENNAEKLLKNFKSSLDGFTSEQKGLFLLAETNISFAKGRVNLELCNETLQYRNYMIPANAAAIYFARGGMYMMLEKWEPAYRDFQKTASINPQSIQKLGGIFYMVRALSGYHSGNLELVQEDIDNALADKKLDKEARENLENIQEALKNPSADIEINDEIFQTLNDHFRSEFDENVEQYQAEDDMHTYLELFAGARLKQLMKNGINNAMNYFEHFLSPIMTEDLKKDVKQLRQELKENAKEDFYPLCEKADLLIEDMIENIPVSTWTDYIKDFARGAFKGYLFGGWGVLDELMDDSSDEQASGINRRINRWNHHTKQILEVYNNIYMNMCEGIDHIAEKYNIPINLTTTEEEDDDDE